MILPKSRVGSASQSVRPNDCFIAVMGMTGAGKSTFVSHCTGQPELASDDTLLSSMAAVTLCSMNFEGTAVHLIDVPGFDNTYRPDEEVLEEQAYWLLKCYEKGVRISGLLYLHRITDPRIQGSALRGLNIFKRMVGPQNYHGVVLATTRWDEVSVDVGDARQQEFTTTEQFWGDVIAGGGKDHKLRYGSPGSAGAIIKYFVNSGKSLTLQIQEEMSEAKLPLFKTSAGGVLWQSWLDERLELERKFEAKRKEMQQEVEKHREENAKRLKTELAEHRRDINRRLAASREIELSPQQLSTRWDERLRSEGNDIDEQIREEKRIIKSSSGNDELIAKAIERYEALKMARERRVERTQLLFQGLGTAAGVTGAAFTILSGLGLIACVVM